MAKKAPKPAAAQDASDESNDAGEGKSTGQGRAVILPNGQRRIDYIREQFYDKNVSRSDIKNNINEMLEKAGRKNEQIAYQIVFAATRNKDVDPRIKEEKKEGEEKGKPDKK